jgi:quercetin dioxygenase-like cupin family protein
MDIINIHEMVGTTEYGGTVKIAVSADTPSNLSGGVFILKPGEALIPDIHESDEIFYVLNGTLSLRNGEKTEEHQISAGYMVRIPKGVVHLSSNESSDNVVILWTFAN